jgi:23S rRNA (cytosine1962-C5)-methyltransferase
VKILASLPRPADARLAVRLTADALRQVRGGHPWVFEGAIRSVSREGDPGDLAVVFDDDRRFVAIGLWDPESPIRIKVLHTGRPVQIDHAWFEERVAVAVAKRVTLASSAGSSIATNAYRVIHGENDGMPGLVVDRYGHLAVLKLYSAAWIPHLAAVVPALQRHLPVASIVLRLARSLAGAPLHGLAAGMSLVGPDVDGPVPFLEHGLHFEADVIHGQKTGHFLDQRDNRVMVGAMSRGARVLDMFSCTGGFSVHAAAGGARVVHSVDASPYAIEAARRNMALNQSRPEVAACRHETTVGEAFATLESMTGQRRRYDIVVVDPPSFAQNKDSVARAISAYERLAALATVLVERDGLLVQASCSSRVAEADFVRAVHTGAAHAGFELEELRRTSHPIDHPIGFREGAYLKCVVVRPVRALRGRSAP